jgi:hypothetical protein
MTAVYCAGPATTTLFDAADAQYAMMKETLTSGGFQGKTEAEAERWLAVEQQELMRRLFQGFVTLRGQAEARVAVVGADGERRTHVRHDASRQLETVFGTVEVERTGYSGRGVSTLYPVDALLNLPEKKYSLEVDRQVSMAAARMSFDESLSMLERLTGAHVPKRQAEEAVQRAARHFDVFYSCTELAFDGPTSELLVLSFDQKGIVLLTKDLAKATRKAAEGKRNKMDTRCSKGEVKRGRKRMAMVAAVYTVAPHERTSSDIIAGLRHLRDATPKARPRPEGKRVWASLEREAKDVIMDAFAEAESRDPRHEKRWLVLVDGDKKLARWARAEARGRGVTITLVLDFIHALEYLWRAAHAFFDEGTEEVEAWVLERLQRMLDGPISNVVAGMTRMATLRGLSAKERRPVDKAAKYFLKRKDMMRYADLLSIGAPIATGIIEGACRHLINDRMDITGARWRRSCAEAVLRLRSLVSSGDFDEYWAFHEDEEAQRNHASRYAGGRVPPVVRPSRRARLRICGGVE